MHAALGVFAIVFALIVIPVFVIQGLGWIKAHRLAIWIASSGALVAAVWASFWFPAWLNERELREAVMDRLFDPESAQFRNVRGHGVAICGEVNAKNKLGGYVGYKQFHALPPVGKDDRWFVLIDDDDENGVARQMCDRHGDRAEHEG